MLEGVMVFFSMSGSVERGSEEERERYLRKGMRMLRTSLGGVSFRTGVRGFSHFLDQCSVERRKARSVTFVNEKE